VKSHPRRATAARSCAGPRSGSPPKEARPMGAHRPHHAELRAGDGTARRARRARRASKCSKCRKDWRRIGAAPQEACRGWGRWGSPGPAAGTTGSGSVRCEAENRRTGAIRLLPAPVPKVPSCQLGLGDWANRSRAPVAPGDSRATGSRIHGPEADLLYCMVP